MTAALGSAALLALLAGPAAAALAASPAPAGKGLATAPPSDEASVSYGKFVAGLEKHEGLFTLYRKENHLYIELSQDQFDKDYYEHATQANGLGGWQILSGDQFAQDARIVRFVKVDEKHVALIYPQQRFVSQPGTPIADAVKLSTADSVFAVVPIAAESTAGGKTVIAADFLLSDNLDLGTKISTAVEDPKNPLGAYRLDPTRTYFGSLKAFPKNVVIEADQTFASAKPDVIDTVVDPRSIQMRVVYNFAELLSSPSYMPRLVDNRVGYFHLPHLHFDRDAYWVSRDANYIVRWNMQATDPSRPSPAVKPMVFTLSNTIPLQYRPTIRNALLAWNKAFENIGILNAVQVQEQPNDPAFDPDDIRYNTIRWLTEANSGGFAEAQFEFDPRTGEIFRTGILIDADLIQGFGYLERDAFVQPIAALSGSPTLRTALASGSDPALWDPETPATARSFHQPIWHADIGARTQFQFGALALGATGQDVPAGYISDFLTWIVLHESGHDFGLMHNFIAHDAYTLDQLRSRSFTAQYGVGSSVMAYTPVNVWPKGYSHGQYWQTTLGPYDYHVIHWGYAPIPSAKTPEAEVPTLDRWASAATQPRFAFASDEDVAWNGHAVDPRVGQWMLSDRPVAWCETQLALARSVLHSLDSHFPQAQQPWDQERAAFGLVMFEYNSCATAMTHYVAGEYLSRGRSGDPGAPRTPLTPVSRSDELRAFQDLSRYLYADDAWQISPTTLRRMVYSEYEPVLDFGYDPLPRFDISLTALVANVQARTLVYMFSPLVLQRLDDLPTKAAPGTTMSLVDLFAWTQNGVFGDLQNGRMPASPMRRNLQRMYAKLLAHTAVNPSKGTPYDAQALARYELNGLAATLKRDLAKGNLDLQTRAHLLALAVEVDRALETKTVLPAG
ncbi:MAG TPA: zinc-dependent metalloprotease [Candidatus Baltobacteraceae bacterium]|nr:zinc-dependent metalloprotease [Candidatus Baltobacteraceae bacterium]